MATTDNTCKKCGCEDKFMPSPAPCPTPIGCPSPEPCSEVMDAQCVIYSGENILCDNDVIISQNDTVAEALENVVEYVCDVNSKLVLENALQCAEQPIGSIAPAGATLNEALEDIVSYFCNAIANVRPYQVYTALLTQISGAPVATVLENTIGNIVWTRSNAGQYVGTLSGAFVSGKTALFIQKSVGLAKIQLVPKDLWIEYTDANTITIITTDDTNLIDNVLNNTTIEIRVYY